MEERVAEVIAKAISELDCLAKGIKRGKSEQVRSVDEKNVIQASVYAWFQSHRPILSITHPALMTIDSGYSRLLEMSERGTTRVTYLEQLKQLKKHLVQCRSVLLSGSDVSVGNGAVSVEFGKLVSDEKIKTILVSRWNEIQRCLEANAPLAALIMMGSMLEAILLARVNKETNLAVLYKLRTAPKDKAGKPIGLSEWTLNNFIEAAAEIGWIRKPARDLSLIIRDYRNLIHPEKELRSGISVDLGDAKMFWSIFTQLIDQIIKSASS